jgi:hypothetical protein
VWIYSSNLKYQSYKSSIFNFDLLINCVILQLHSCTGWCTIVLRKVGRWLEIVNAGCVALASALLCCTRLLHGAVARGTVGHWLVRTPPSMYFIGLNY